MRQVPIQLQLKSTSIDRGGLKYADIGIWYPTDAQITSTYAFSISEDELLDRLDHLLRYENGWDKSYFSNVYSCQPLNSNTGNKGAGTNQIKIQGGALVVNLAFRPNDEDSAWGHGYETEVKRGNCSIAQ